MLHIVVGIVGFIWIPRAREEVSLPCDRAALHMNAIDEAVLELRRSPVAPPDQAATLRELTQESEIPLPAGFSADRANDVAGQAVVMHADGSKFGCPAIEKLLLAVLTAICFVDHDFNSHLLG